MAGAYLEEGDEVVDSPMGSGIVTDITQAGYPRVNNVAVAWLERADGAIFDPRNVRAQHLAERALKGKPNAQER